MRWLGFGVGLAIIAFLGLLIAERPRTTMPPQPEMPEASVSMAPAARPAPAPTAAITLPVPDTPVPDSPLPDSPVPDSAEPEDVESSTPTPEVSAMAPATPLTKMDAPPQPERPPAPIATATPPVEIPVTEANDTIDAPAPELLRHYFWSTFASRLTAEGFAEHVTHRSGLAIDVERRGPEDYNVWLGYTDADDLATKLALLSDRTGFALSPPEPPPPAGEDL